VPQSPLHASVAASPIPVRAGAKPPSSSPSTRVVRPMRDELCLPTAEASRPEAADDPRRSSRCAIVPGVGDSPSSRSYRQECPAPSEPSMGSAIATFRI
jgi:hypothetical protein